MYNTVSVGERFTGFGQAMIHNGGRNGVALTFGARWALGKDSTKSKAETSKTEPNSITLKPTKIKVNKITKLKTTRAKQWKLSKQVQNMCLKMQKKR